MGNIHKTNYNLKICITTNTCYTEKKGADADGIRNNKMFKWYYKQFKSNQYLRFLHASNKTGSDTKRGIFVVCEMNEEKVIKMR